MAVTREKLSCPVYGIASDLPSNQLPSAGDTMRLYSFLRVQLPCNIKSSEIITNVATDIRNLWIKAGIPTISLRRVEQRIESMLQNLRNILKKKGKSKLSAISAANVNGLTLFDIPACHCDQFDDYSCP